MSMCISITPALTSGVFTILGSSFFLQNSRVIFFLRHVNVHCDCTGGNKTDVPCLGLGFFPAHVRIICLVACPCAFRLGRLAQNGGPFLGAQPFPVNSCGAMLFGDVHVHFGCTGSHKVCSVGVSRSWSPAFFFLHTTAPCACQLTCLCACRLRMLARSLRCGVLQLLVCGIFIVNSRVNGLLWR